MEKLLLLTVLLKLSSLEVLADSQLPKPPCCGKTNLTSSSARVFNGSITGLDEYPWMGHLHNSVFFYDEYSGELVLRKYDCTSSLISSNWVLTAGHCVFDPDLEFSPLFINRTASVTLGEWDTANDPDCVKKDVSAPKSVTLAVADIIVHEVYKTTRYNHQYDIALLRLERNVKFSPYIQPICLPLEPIAQEQPNYVGSQVIITGWGYYDENNIESQFKRKTTVTVKAIDSEICSKDVKHVLPFNKTSQLCVGGPDGGGCPGDSGGPLLWQSSYDKSTYYQIGVNSLDRQNCTNTSTFKSLPTIYVRVDAFIDWIVETIEGIDRN